MRLAVVGHVEWVDFARRRPSFRRVARSSRPTRLAGSRGRRRGRRGPAGEARRLGDAVHGARRRSPRPSRGGRARSPRRPCRGGAARRSAAPRALLRRRRRRADDHAPRPEARPARGRPAAVGRARARPTASTSPAAMPEAVRAARAARVLVASARELPTLVEAAVALDVLVASAREPASVRAGDLEPGTARMSCARKAAPAAAVEPGGRFAAAPLPGPVVDTYGAGDAFAAGLTYALAGGSRSATRSPSRRRCGARFSRRAGRTTGSSGSSSTKTGSRRVALAADSGLKWGEVDHRRNGRRHVPRRARAHPR